MISESYLHVSFVRDSTWMQGKPQNMGFPAWHLLSFTRAPPRLTCVSLSLSPVSPLNPFQPWFTFHGVLSGKARRMRAQCRVSIQAGYEIAKVP